VLPAVGEGHDRRDDVDQVAHLQRGVIPDGREQEINGKGTITD